MFQGDNNGCIHIASYHIATTVLQDLKIASHCGPSYNLETYLQRRERVGQKHQDQSKSAILNS